MPHTDFTTALARLLSDPDLLGRFIQDPLQVCMTLQVNDTDRDVLLQINPADLAAQAQTLLTKRWHEIRAILPISLLMLGNSSFAEFKRYAVAHWPTGHQRHWLDAAGFIQYLQAQGLPWHAAEENRVQFMLANKKLAFDFITYPKAKVWRQWALQIQLRLGKKSHEFCLYLASF